MLSKPSYTKRSRAYVALVRIVIVNPVMASVGTATVCRKEESSAARSPALGSLANHGVGAFDTSLRHKLLYLHRRQAQNSVVRRYLPPLLFELKQ